MAGKPKTRHKHRSPNAPAISLDEALVRVRKVYERERRHPATFSAFAAAWGMSPKSSGAKQAMAALRRFKLVSDTSGDGAKVSDIAVRLILAERGSPEWRDAARAAALAPEVHMTMWNKYGGGLPSDGSLLLYLVDQGFSEEAGMDFLKQYRRTLAFAQLDTAEHGPDAATSPASDTVPAMQQDTITLVDTGAGLAPPARPQPPQPQRPRPAEELRMPLFGKAMLTVSWSQPLTKAEWKAMVQALEAQGPVLARAQEAAAEAE